MTASALTDQEQDFELGHFGPELFVPGRGAFRTRREVAAFPGAGKA